MVAIFSYSKVSTPHTTIQMALPDYPDMAEELRCTELCTLGNVTYVSVPAGAVLPTQPAQITVSPVTLTPELLAAIKYASPHVALISERVVKKIRDAYSIDDELFFARIGSSTGIYTPTAGELSEKQVFSTFVESVRQWGRNERAKLGLA